ncbi:MAG TPA: VapE domain-containing protein [Kofleriaceae bacterium]
MPRWSAARIGLISSWIGTKRLTVLPIGTAIMPRCRYQVVRFDPKEFRQRRPDPEHPDRWIWKLGDVRRVLSRLDRVREADPDATIYVVEGENDVHALESLGLVATCNPQGAGKWSAVTDCAKVALCGRRVTIIADKDDKGRKHAADVASRLREIASEVRILESPIGKDAADWIAAGATADDVELARASVRPAQLDEEFDVDRDGKKYHVFSRPRVVAGLPGFGPRLDDDALNHLRLKIDSEFNLRLGKEFFHDVIVDHGHEHRFHPVRDYLPGLRWDGTPRLDGWLTRYAAAEDTRYTRAIGSLVLIAAVRRVRRLGSSWIGEADRLFRA